MSLHKTAAGETDESGMSTIGATNRMTGMFSGIDTDSLVQALVSSQQSKIDTIFQNRERAQWKVDMYTDFNNQLRIFREEFGSAAGETSMISKGSFYNSKTDLATNNYLKVTASASANVGQYSVRIDQVASAVSMYGSRATTSDAGLSTTTIDKTAISQIASFNGGAYSNSDFSFSINGVEFDFKSTDTLKTIMNTVNKSEAGVTMSYSQSTDSFKIVSNTMGEYKSMDTPGDKPVNDNPFTMTKPVKSDYSSDGDYQAALDEYNTAKAEYDAGDGKIYNARLEAWNKKNAEYVENEKRNISFTDDNGFLSHLGLNDITTGADAKISINGGEVRTFSTNEINLDGVNFSLLSATPAGETVTFGVSHDTSGSVDKVKKFVEDFNVLVKNLYEAAYTKKNKDYKPLTDTQRDQLTEKEEEKWDAKAKEGTLYRDSNLTKILDQMRNMMSSELGGGRLSEIGISVAKYEVGEPFKLELDPEKLSAALIEDPEKVYNIFAATESDGVGEGLMTRVNAAINTFTSNTKSIEIQNLNNDITKLTKQMATQEDKIAEMAEKYYLQYAKLETALQKMQSQQASMASLLGTGSSS